MFIFVENKLHFDGYENGPSLRSNIENADKSIPSTASRSLLKTRLSGHGQSLDDDTISYYNSEIIEMERRANAILNGRKRSTILSTSASAKPKSDESTTDVKKHRYAFSTLLKKERDAARWNSRLIPAVRCKLILGIVSTFPALSRRPLVLV